jgi:hypothetical protein
MCIMKQVQRITLLLTAFAIYLLGAAPPFAHTEEPAAADDLASRPIATAKGELGDLLRKWQEEGTAAGNAGDWYDNRDRTHSDLATAPYPQLSRVVYSEEELRQRADWAAARSVRPHVTFGNSSTSASVENGGSNPRHYYTAARGIELLYEQYTHNNLYIYPEHRDHDPGHSGRGSAPDGGYGDLYPANTPYLIISQGSSGSDQPFMRALPHVLAAFRPEVKKKLVETGLLMPTVQMLLRSTNNHLTDPAEYLTGKAHPTVFEGRWVDPLAMVKAAHEIKLEEIPPLVKLGVIEEQELIAGCHFFDVAPNERFVDTPSAIVRLFRGRDRLREMTVSAADTLNVNGRPLTFIWVLLRGDSERVKIEPREGGKSAKLTIAWHERRPASPGGIESNRIDVGVFAHNGVHYSAPAFVSFFCFDNEARAYDDTGRVLEIGYGASQAVVDVKNWPKLMRQAVEGSPAARLLPLSDGERAALVAAAPKYEELDAGLKLARERQQTADKAWREAGDALRAAQADRDKLQKVQGAEGGDAKAAELEAARQKAAEAEKLQATANEQRLAAIKETQAAEAALRDVLHGKRDELGASLDAVVRRAVESLLDDSQLADAHRAAIEQTAGKEKTQALLDAELSRLAALGMIDAADKGEVAFAFTPLRRAKDGRPQWTAYERDMLRRANLRVLTELLFPESLTGRVLPNYVDPRLTIPKTWRDVYRYSADGRMLGWTRYAADGVSEFNPHGELVLERDDKGRCLKARTVRYAVKQEGRTSYALAPSPGDAVLTYKYATDDDYLGRVVEREAAE